jgi:hypothetical protein
MIYHPMSSACQTRRDIICPPHYILKSCETRSVGLVDILTDYVSDEETCLDH